MKTGQAGPEQVRAVATRVSMVSILGNLLLTVFKLIAGILAHSGAMISDAIHSASDVVSSFVVIIGVRIAAKAPDEGHPYGHERFECVAAMVLAAILVLAGGGIGVEAVRKIAGAEALAVPGTLALAAAAVSIVSKEAMFWYTRGNARKIDSTALMAEAWHHRSDALSSVGALIGIAGARMGFPVLEPVASLIICLLVLKVAVEIFKDAIDRIVDHACDAEMEARLADPETYRDPEKAAELTRQYNAVRETVERLYAEWEEMEEQEG